LNKPYQSWTYNQFVGEPESEVEASKSKKRKTSPLEAKVSLLKLMEDTDSNVLKEASISFFADCDALRVKDVKALEREIVRVKNKRSKGKKPIPEIAKYKEDANVGLNDDPLQIILASQDSGYNGRQSGKSRYILCSN
jgi:hypothetical protein